MSHLVAVQKSEVRSQKPRRLEIPEPQKRAGFRVSELPEQAFSLVAGGAQTPSPTPTPSALFLLDFPSFITNACITILTMPSKNTFDEAFGERPDLQQRVLAVLGKISPSIGPRC